MEERLYKINNILLQKLEDTSYLIPDAEIDASESFELFQETFPDSDAMERVFYPIPNTLTSERNPNGTMIGFAIANEGSRYVTTPVIDRIITKLVKAKASTLLLIINAPLFHIASKRLTSIQGEYRVVIFRQDQLMFNPTAHVRVPKHVLLTSEEAITWLNETRLKRSQLPRIYDTDIQALYLDAQPKDIIKVIRPSPTVGEFVHHVLVVRTLRGGEI